MSQLMDHAQREMKLVGLEESTPMYKAILRLVELFDGQGHNEDSAAYAAAAVAKLFKMELLSPLTGEEEEWTLIHGLLDKGEKFWQNKRRPYVFKDESGECWDIEGKIFYYYKDDGRTVYYCNKDSHTKIEFPYTPGLLLEYREPTQEHRDPDTEN